MMSALVANYYSELSTGSSIKADNVGLLLGMFITIMFSAKISGSHFNPIITFSFMIGNVKSGNFDRVLGFLYIGAQVLGAQLGAIFAKIFASGHENDIPLNVPIGEVIQQIILEVVASFFLVFMYLASTDKKTKFTSDNSIQTVIQAGSYLGAMLLAGTKLIAIRASPVNPAISFAIILWNPSKDNWESSYVFFGSSFGGAFLALIFFRFVYQKTAEAIEEINDEEEGSDHNEEALLG